MKKIKNKTKDKVQNETEVMQKILIVEDDIPVMRAISDKLNREGFEVIEARNGKEGLSMAFDKKPDIILLDILMPVMDGPTMMKSLREDGKWGKEVPIIMLTNLSTAVDVKTVKVVIEAEPIYYLVKSNWSMADIVKKVKEVLNNKKGFKLAKKIEDSLKNKSLS
jgi:DNA-binding response OmpR family regulator